MSGKRGFWAEWDDTGSVVLWTPCPEGGKKPAKWKLSVADARELAEDLFIAVDEDDNWRKPLDIAPSPQLELPWVK